MNVATITMPKEKALAAYREYREHARTAQDRAIMTGYRAIAKGRAIINASDAILKAGFDLCGRPRLAMGRAHRAFQTWRTWASEGAFQVDISWRYELGSDLQQGFQYKFHRAQTPIIPPAIRPADKQLRHYWILWEADWKEAPRDPLLLKHLSGDLYVVLAAWDLTDLERAAMGRLS